MNKTLSFAVIALGLCGVAGCGGSADDPPAASIPAPQDGDQGDAVPVENTVATTAATGSASPPTIPPPAPRNLHPEVVIATSLGEVRVRLDAEQAPETVDNFLRNYVRRDYYSGTIFHYVENGFIAAAGGYLPDLTAKPTRAPIRNESRNGLKNRRGTLAMSRQADYADSATSQFFINLQDNPSLDFVEAAAAEDEPTFGYCVFGEIVDGMDVVDRIAESKVQDQGDFPNVPVEPITIESIEQVK